MSNTISGDHKKIPTEVGNSQVYRLDMVLLLFVSIYIVLYMSFYIKKSTLTHIFQSPS